MLLKKVNRFTKQKKDLEEANKKIDETNTSYRLNVEQIKGYDGLIKQYREEINRLV